MGSLLNVAQNNIENNLKKTKLKNHEDIFKKLIGNYLRLDINLGNYYKQWSDKDELFKSTCEQFYGIRMLNQEPVENLFSFICSQNNHISRYVFSNIKSIGKSM